MVILKNIDMVIHENIGIDIDSDMNFLTRYKGTFSFKKNKNTIFSLKRAPLKGPSRNMMLISFRQSNLTLSARHGLLLDIQLKCHLSVVKHFCCSSK